MDLKHKIRILDLSNSEFIYNSLCDLEDEVLEAVVFKIIFNENIENQRYLYLIAENKNEKIGFITFHTQLLLHHSGIVGEIQEFYIIPKYRNKGVGRQLLNKIFEFADKNGLKSIEVTTSKKRIENIAVYENLGFNLTHNKFTIYK